MSEDHPEPAPLDISETESEEPNPRAFTLPELREKARQWIAWALVAIFGVEVLGAMAAARFCKTDIQNIKDIMELILSPTIGLVGAVVGFYFGSSESASGTSAI